MQPATDCPTSITPTYIVGQWAKPIEAELTELLEKEFSLPHFEFVYDEHWDLGHGWSGDM